ncbi:PP2C family protein-serine/threonine phosphatase [Planctomicrobium piriforme]|uniref:Protein phosphatase n=1 Tax=Planctomicrobium piriforme TaxID=1576369 RepID=A0A1I3CEJ7_9PLAN|nr:protein phosphatase 2C domain-containing protein [Planctomicrobium piriforme]SFH72639.1 protein phosphatase [Planctomicrobium piriforme]
MHAQLDCHGLTDVGLKRKENQDQFLIAALSKSLRVHQSSLTISDEDLLHSGSRGHVLIVADGMGGHAGGRRASQLAVETMARSLLDGTPWLADLAAEGNSIEPQKQTLIQALDHCQATIEQAGLAVPADAEMGTTFTMAYLLWPQCYLLHVGDSRAYLCRTGALKQLTHDQTVAARLREAGQLSAESAKHSIFAHSLWSYLGVDASSLKPQVTRVELQVGDVLLLCSDGLSNVVPDEEILDHLLRAGESKVACEVLIQSAIDQGAPDNVTAIVARFCDAPNTPGGVTTAHAAVPDPEETQEFPAQKQAVVAQPAP